MYFIVTFCTIANQRYIGEDINREIHHEARGASHC